MLMYAINRGLKSTAKCLVWFGFIRWAYVYCTPQPSNVTFISDKLSAHSSYEIRHIQGNSVKWFLLPVKNPVEWRQALAESYHIQNLDKIQKMFFQTALEYHQPEYLEIKR